MLKPTRSLSLLTLCAALLLAVAAPAPAATGAVTARVTRVLISNDDRWGGCMALLSVNPQTVLSGCGSGWVTFSCSGHFTNSVRAYRMLDAAELALATGKNVTVYFQDDKMHNGYCFANRIDVIR
jgi:hypothetical protein